MTTESNKKVLVLLGSPRKNGNSAILAEHIAAGAESAGAEVETVFIHGMNISPCRACWNCQKPDAAGCVIDDDMQGVFRKLIDADAWVIATPVHWFNMSAQTKLWIDRCFALARYGKNPFKKKIAIAIAYGGTNADDSGAVNAIRSFEDSFRFTGSTITGIVHGSATAAGDIKKNKQVLADAEELGEKLVV